jgi:hypothetical protein
VNISWVGINDYFFTKVIEINGKRNGAKKSSNEELNMNFI